MRYTRLHALWRYLRLPIAFGIVAAAIAACVVLSAPHDSVMADFRAFYCSGRVLLEHHSPYDAAPLGSCEHVETSLGYFAVNGNIVLPAPLPGYEILALTPLAALPFTLAAIIWFLIITTAVGIAVALFARMGLGDAASIMVAIAFGFIGFTFTTGEIAPIALLGIALAAWAVSHRDAAHSWLAMTGGIVLSFFEPQIGVAVAIACAVLTWRGALAAASAVAVLAVAALGALGIGGNIAYVQSVLPAHLAAELPVYFQFSLSWVLDRLGVSPNVALSIGRIEWIVMLALTICFARSRFGRHHPEMAVLAAPAFAVVGGPFLHLDQIGLAIPAALWLGARRSRVEWLPVIPIVALAIPLLTPLELEYAVPVPVIAVLCVVIAFWLGAVYGRSERAALYSAAAVATALVVTAHVLSVHGALDAVSAPVPAIAQNLAQGSWARFLAADSVLAFWPISLAKLPTWFGILATAGGCVALAMRRPQSAPA